MERLLSHLVGETAGHTAKTLFDEFGNLACILACCRNSPNSNSQPEKIVRDYLATLHEAMTLALRAELLELPSLSNADKVIAYLTHTMRNLSTEVVRVFYLNGANQLIHDMIVGRGSVSEAPIYPREILKYAIEKGATALILAHNHPSGDPTPSSADKVATEKLVGIARELDIAVHDHIILGSHGWFSMRRAGQLSSTV